MNKRVFSFSAEKRERKRTLVNNLDFASKESYKREKKIKGLSPLP